jgi:hypothetical protein
MYKKTIGKTRKEKLKKQKTLETLNPTQGYAYTCAYPGL